MQTGQKLAKKILFKQQLIGFGKDQRASNNRPKIKPRTSEINQTDLSHQNLIFGQRHSNLRLKIAPRI